MLNEWYISCHWQVEGSELAGTGSSVSALDFSSSTSSLAIGEESGLVRYFTLLKLFLKENTCLQRRHARNTLL